MNRLPLWSRIAVVPLTVAILALAAARIIGGSDPAPSCQQPPASDEGRLLFVWAPSGGQLAFRATVNGASDIWLAEVSTGALQQVTHGAGASYPVWLGKEAD